MPGVGARVAEVRALIETSELWKGKWSIRVDSYNDQNGFDPQPLAENVRRRPSPVVLLEPVQRHPCARLEKNLEDHSIVLVERADNSIDLLQVLENVRMRHESGEPLIPRRFALAILLLRKLEKRKYWGGRDKGYMYYDDLVKGRGVDVSFKDELPAVVGILVARNILEKKPSRHRQKFALKQTSKKEVYDIIERRDLTLLAPLRRDKNRISCRCLDQATEL